MRKVCSALIMMLFCIVFIAGNERPCFSQEIQATINGTVVDQTGAVVPNASITIFRVDTNTIERTIATNQSGGYVVTNLVPSVYKITVKAQNFKSFVAENVVLHVAEKLSVNAVLVPGEVSENVVVQADEIALQTDTAAQSTTITGAQVRELELNNRNFQQLVTLQPGVASSLGDEAGYGLNSNTDISVNGARETANNWTVDGADINDSGSNGTLLNMPSVDAIQEFTLERSMYDASFGRSAGGQVLVATKSGTNAFHGDLYEFVRNDILNANTYFGNKTGTARGIERYNNFGFTLGGPIYIPKLYNTNRNKAFFFWSEEWRKVSSPTTANFTAATSDMLNGLISGTVSGAASGCTTYNSSTNKTQISSSCYSSNTKVYLSNIFSKYPANNGDDYTYTYSSKDNFRQDTIRLDYNLNSNLKFFARYMKDTLPSNDPMGLWAGNNYPNVANTALQVPGTNVVGNLVWTISPRMVNELEFAYTEGNIQSSWIGTQPANDTSLINQLTNNWAYKDPYNRLPDISINSGENGISDGSTPYHETNMDRNVFDNFSLVLNKHTLRAGATASWMLKSENASNGTASFTFNKWSDFLLGNVAAYSQSSTDIIPDLRYTTFEGYVQDDWKALQRLTINIGLRYSYFPSPYDAANTMSNFDPSLYSVSEAPTLDSLTGEFVSGQTVTPATYGNGLIFPSGKACTNAQAISSQVSCSPYGNKVNPNSNGNIAPRFGFSWGIGSNNRLVLRGGYGIFYDRMLNGMWEQNAFANPPLVQSTEEQNTSFDKPMSGTTVISLAPVHLSTTGMTTLKIPSYQSYNLSLQQKFREGLMIEVAYVGSQQRHLLGEIDRNQPTLAVRQANQNANVNAIRPYSGYSYIATRASIFSGNYNSLQASLNYHTTKGLTFGAAYTWSKVLANSGMDRDTTAYDTYNLKGEYGPEPFNEPQVFVFNYVYDLPFFKAQHNLKNYLLGGWQVSGITTMKSGFSTTVTQSTDPFACTENADGSCVSGSAANTFPGGLGMSPIDSSVQVRANQVGSVHYKKSMDKWFDTFSFADATGEFGSAKVGSVLGPGQQNWDIGVMKNVKFAGRYSFQLRGEFFNAFNHTSPSTIDTAITDSTFGEVTATHNPRNIQLGAKLYF